MRNIFIENYWNTFSKHPLEDTILQIVTVLIVLLIAMFAIRLVGRKNLSQLSLPNLVFVFILNASLGALITRPRALIVALIVITTIIVFVVTMQKLQMEVKWLKKIFIGRTLMLMKDGRLNEEVLEKQRITVDQLESHVRVQGVPSLDLCKTLTLEPNGSIGVELKTEFKPINKRYFDEAMKQILEGINDIKYKEAEMPKIRNSFEDVEFKKE
jgi:uncharacterized membrane protein YcaP (DUF421 family)